jgi:hypothetical protein
VVAIERLIGASRVPCGGDRTIDRGFKGAVLHKDVAIERLIGASRCCTSVVAIERLIGASQV